MRRTWPLLAVAGLMLVTAACGGGPAAPSAAVTAVPSAAASPSAAVTPAPVPAQSTAPLPSPTAQPSPTSAAPAKPAVYPNIPIEHIVVVVEENHAYSQIIGNAKAPFLNALIKNGALMTNAFAITHPSQPNYFALFSGSTQSVKDDSCKGPYTADNLSTELAKAKLTFKGYSELQPSVGYTGCSYKGYARKHNPWAQFSNVPKEQNLPLTDFPSDFAKLPAVSFVVPAVENDMHDGTVEEADSWLKAHLGAYATWANEHRSLLIVTWDEDDTSHNNHIPVIIAGPMVKPGSYPETVNHYHVLRTIEDLFGLGQLGETGNVKGISTIWK